MQTVLTTNGSHHTVLLVDEHDVVHGGWLVDDAVMRNYLTTGQHPQRWRAGSWEFPSDPEADRAESSAGFPRSISSYGREVGRNGLITDPQVRSYWEQELGVTGLPGHVGPEDDESQHATINR